MERFGGLSAIDIVRRAERYRPVLFAALAILLAAAVLPGPEQVATEAAAGAVGPRTPLFAGDDGDRDSPSPPAGDAPGPPPAVPLATHPAGGPASLGTAPRAGGTPTPRPSGTAAPTPPPAGGAERAAPLEASYRIAASGWASRAAGTPLDGVEVPEGSLPVGRRAGQTDRLSFVRLEGSSTALILTPVPDQGANRFARLAGVALCPITEPSWAPAEGVPLDEAPEHDCGAAIEGEAGEDGRWTFDLTGVAEPTSASGFALVPAGSAPDFQVAFAVDP